MTAMDIYAAISAIKAASEKAKLSTKLRASLNELDLLQKVLDGATYNTVDNTKASLALRSGLSRLYTPFPILTVNFTMTALSAINCQLSVESCGQKRTNVISTLGSLASSALSGLLDFLEGASSVENKTIVANSLYPLLNDILFCNPKSLLTDDSIYLLYVILLETVRTHSPNQKTLRATFKAGSRFGTLISQTKAYLPLEALLQLFIALLPPKKSVKERGKFRENAFPSESFQCSEKIFQLLISRAATPDGNELSLDLLHMLAASDISYPQPFDVEDFKTNSSKSRPIRRVYVNHRGILANLELPEEMVDTFVVQYSTFKHVRIASADRPKASIFISLTSPPTVGASPGSQAAEGDTSISFVIEESEKKNFLKALQARGLSKDVLHPAVKLSKAESHLQLDFEPAKADGPSLTQERAMDISRLWENENPCPAPGDGVTPTSPLFSATVPAEDVVQEQTPPASSEPKKSEPAQGANDPVETPNPKPLALDEFVFGSSDDELTDIENTEMIKPTRNRTGKSKAPPPLESEEDGVRAKRGKRGPHKMIVISDDEESQERPAIESKHFKKSKPLPSPRHLGTPSSLKRSLETPSEVLNARQPSVILISPSPPKAKASARPKTRQQAKAAAGLSLKPKPPADAELSTTPGKRKFADEEDKDVAEAPFSKRLKKEVQATAFDSPPRVPRERPVKRYGRQGRFSSPISSRDTSALPPPPKKPTRAPAAKGNSKPAPRPVAKVKAGKVESDKTGIMPAKKATPVLIEDSPPPKNITAAAVDPQKKHRKEAMKDKLTMSNSLKEGQKPSSAPMEVKEPAEDNNQSPAPSPPEKESIEKPKKILALLSSPSRSPVTKKRSKVAPLKRKKLEPEAKPLARRISDVFPFRVVGENSSPGPDMAHKEDITIVAQHAEPLEALEGHFDAESTLAIDAGVYASPEQSPSRRSVEERSQGKVPPFQSTGSVCRPLEAKMDSPLKSASMRSPRIHTISHSPLTRSPGKRNASPLKPRYLPSPSVDTSYKYETRKQTMDVGTENRSSGISHGASLNSRTAMDVQLESPRSRHPPSHSTRSPKSEIPEIVHVIQEITQVVINNASKRFTNVRRDLRTAQFNTIREISREFSKIHSETASVDWSKKLEDIQSGYASEYMKISNEWDAFSRMTDETNAFLAKTIQTHHRNSTTKKFPKKFIATPYPDHILHPKLSL